MRLLLVLSHPPYDGTDVAWNALRLAGAALERGHDVRMFLMNDAVDIVRQPPGEVEFDLAAMVRDLVSRGAAAKLCQTCLQRCGFGGTEVIMNEAQVAGMGDLVDWLETADRALTF